MTVVEKIITSPAQVELSESYLEYSMSVVYARAIPSIDGFKPVQRRILFGLHDSGWTHEKPFVKVSRLAGHVMGVLHPHGDSSISDAMVKLGQPFYTNVPFLDTYGNWGDISGSGPAAARYIEGKLSQAAEFILREIKEDTVDMKPNYDGTATEPVLLPIMFPVLLVNGNFGIGVGFGNKMPSHNLREVIDGTKVLLKKPNASLDEIMKYIPGPDFPTGAQIIGTDGIREAYETGQGIIRLRAKAEIKPTSRGKHEIIFTELPYGVKTENVITKIKEALKANKLAGLADAKDLTDRKNGLRVVVDVKAGNNPQFLLQELYKETALEESFGINSTVLVEGEPRTVGLLEMIQIFIDFRKKTILRRSNFRKDKKNARLHILEGLLKSLANIDTVIKIVRGADDTATAQTELMKKFKIDEEQADYVLSIPLRRLTKYDVLQLQDEKNRLELEIAEIDKILNDESVLQKVMITELDEVKKSLGTDRKSVIIGGNLAEHLQEAKAAAKVSAEVADDPCIIAVYASGTLTRSPGDPVVSGRGKIDPLISTLSTSVRGKFLAITNTGRAIRTDSLHIAEGSKITPSAAEITLTKGERIIAFAPSVAETGVLLLGTKQGVVKATKADWNTVKSDEFPVMGLSDGDEILSGRWVDDQENTDVVFMTAENILRIAAKTIRGAGRTAGGVAGISLSDGASALSFAVLTGEERDNAEFFTVAGDDSGKPASMKRSSLSEVSVKGRGSQGMRSMKMLKGQSSVVDAFCGVDLLVVDQTGKRLELPALSKRDASGLPVEASSFVFGKSR